MNLPRKMIALLTMTAMLTCPKQLSAQDDYYCADTGGYCYEDCTRASCIAPAIALGTIALVAIIAVAIQNTGSGHGHCHD